MEVLLHLEKNSSRTADGNHGTQASVVQLLY